MRGTGIVIMVAGLLVILGGLMSLMMLQIGAYWVVDVSPTSYSLETGSSVVGTISVTSSISSVTLMARNVPSGLSVTFSPSSGNAPFTSTMTISASSGIDSFSGTFEVGCSPTLYGMFKTVSVSVTGDTPIPPNTPPIASFTFNKTHDPYVTFNGTGSYDPDGTIVDYKWNFGDGVFAYGGITTHVYSSNGTYIITLTVTDEKGETGSVSKSVNIGSAVEPPQKYYLNLYINPANTGSINVSYTLYPSIIIQEREFLEDTSLRLFALPNTGYKFVEWSGDVTGTTNLVYITMNSDKSVSAHFTEEDVTPPPDGTTYVLAVSSNPPEGGSVSGAGTYPEGEFVIVTATPSAGYAFDYWLFDASGTNVSVTMVMDEDKLVMANFKTVITTYKFYGYVRDTDTKENIAGATIGVDGEEYDTDSSGYFEIQLEAGTYDVVAFADGYKTTEGEITVVNSDIALIVGLKKIKPYEIGQLLIFLGAVLLIIGFAVTAKGSIQPMRGVG